MGKAHVAGITIAAIGFLYYVAYGMDWANTIHDFNRNYLSSMPRDQLGGMATQWIVNFLLQPVFVIGSMSVPLAFCLILAVGGTAYFARKR